MTTSAISKQAVAGRVRPLNIFTDLPTVADMIETCFEGFLDGEGLAAVDSIRRRGRDKNFLAWAPRVVDTISLPLSGFVYEVDGILAGNASLIPYHRAGVKHYLVANVATLPIYRRQGIARKLTEAAVAKAISQGADSIWLQVRQDNPGAVNLYEQLGFRQRVTTNTWHLPPDYQISPRPYAGVNLRKTTFAEWEQLSPTYKQVYPPWLDWYYGHRVDDLTPGFWPGIQRFFRDEQAVLVSAKDGAKLAGGIAVKRVIGHPDKIFCTRPLSGGANTMAAMLSSLSGLVEPRKKQVFEFPPSEYDQLIFDAGFVKQRALIWMKYELPK